MDGSGGHRAVPHTADVRIEAWGATREECLAQAVAGLVGCFADLSGARPRAVRRLRPTGRSDDELLAALLEDVLFRLDVHGEVPVEAAAERTEGGLEVRLSVTGLDSVEITGAVPKAVSWNELHLSPAPSGWSCAATVDV
ncbi:archease [Streptomyces aidingensis]|nr:archease [Streptomyces aidingensis]